MWLRMTMAALALAALTACTVRDSASRLHDVVRYHYEGQR